MLEAFDGWGFQPYSLLPDLSIELGRKIVSIQVEVFEAPLDYNLLLGRNWFYSMTRVASLEFHFLQFPHQGNIVTTDQIDSCSGDVTSTKTNNVPLLGKSSPQYHNIRVRILKDSSLMEVFLSNSSLPTSQVSSVNMISSIADDMQKGKTIADVPCMSPLEALYDAIQSTSDAYIDDHHLVA